MTNTSFDIIDIIRTLQKKRRFIVAMTIAAIALGCIFLVIRHKKYKGVARFFVNNPLYGDRSTLFRSQDTRYVDYFGGDDDVDRIFALAASDTVMNKIIKDCDFETVYKRKDTSLKDHEALISEFKKSFNIKRTEYRDVEVSFVARDPIFAAQVANTTVKVLEETFRHYYTAVKISISTTIGDKVVKLDSAINVLTDSLANMRDRYGIYGLISPDRHDITNSDIKGGKGMGRGIEQVQNVESVKDQLVMDKAHYISALNEFTATMNNSMDFLKVISRAETPSTPSSPAASLVLIIAAVLGLLFSSIYVLLLTYFRKLNAVVR